MPSGLAPGWIATTVFLVASASIGWTAGFLAGQSGPDAGVLAAVLPVVISGAGGALIMLLLKSPEPPAPQAYYVTGSAVILFTTTLLLGTQNGISAAASFFNCRHFPLI